MMVMVAELLLTAKRGTIVSLQEIAKSVLSQQSHKLLVPPPTPHPWQIDPSSISDKEISQTIIRGLNCRHSLPLPLAVFGTLALFFWSSVA